MTKKSIPFAASKCQREFCNLLPVFEFAIIFGRNIFVGFDELVFISAASYPIRINIIRPNSILVDDFTDEVFLAQLFNRRVDLLAAQAKFSGDSALRCRKFAIVVDVTGDVQIHAHVRKFELFVRYQHMRCRLVHDEPAISIG